MIVPTQHVSQLNITQPYVWSEDKSKKDSFFDYKSDDYTNIKDQSIKSDADKTSVTSPVENEFVTVYQPTVVSQISSEKFNEVITIRRLDTAKDLLYKMLENEDFLTLPVLYSQIKNIAIDLFNSVSYDQIFLKMEISYLEQAVISSSWDQFNNGKIKTLISVIEQIKNKGKWNHKGLTTISRLFISSNFKIAEPILYEEGKDTKISV